MRNGMKRAALGLAAAALCLGLMGCSLSSGFADYDVSGYFQALLDSSYKNQNENYATVAATTEENAQQNNTTTVRNAAVNFCNTYGVTPSDDQLSQLQEVMSQALAQASYTVQDEVKTETGYTLEIVIDPIVNFSDMGDDIRQLRNQAQDEATQTDLYKQMETMLADTAANVYIQDLCDLVAMRQDLGGLKFYPIYVLDLSTVYFTQQ